MAGQLPTVRNGEVVAALEKDGWYVARITGHVQMRHPVKPGTTSVPNHPSDQTCAADGATYLEAGRPHRRRVPSAALAEGRAR